MLKLAIVSVLAMCLVFCGEAGARGGGHSSGYSSGGSHSSSRKSSGSAGKSSCDTPKKGIRKTSGSSGKRSSHSPAYARGSSASYRYPSYGTGLNPHFHVASPSSPNYAFGVRRDSQGRIARSDAARHQFMNKTGYPNGRPGYVIDHIVPLKRGGADSPSNMQWQTKEQAKAKDRWE